MEGQREIEQMIEQIKELQSFRNLMHEVRERIKNTENEHLEEYLGSVLGEIDKRMRDPESSFHKSYPQHLSVRNEAKRGAKSASSLPSFVRWEALSATLAGLAWMVAGIIDVVSSGERAPEVLGFAPLNEVLYCVALVGMLGGIVGLHAQQAPSYGRLGRMGFLASFLGVLFLLIGFTLSFLAESVVLEERVILDQVLLVSFLGTLVGFVLLGAATLRLGVLPRWCGALLITCLPLAITLGDYGGAIALGLIWLALAYVLLLPRDVSALFQTSAESEPVSEVVRS